MDNCIKASLLNPLFILIKRYTAHYKGIPAHCWRPITLSLFQKSIGSIFYFLSIYFVNNLRLPITTTGIIITFYGLGAIIGSYSGGELSDKFPAQNITIASLIIQSIAIYSLLFTSNPLLLILILFILGCSVYGFNTANTLHALSLCNNDQRLKLINILSMSSNLGLGVSAVIIGIISSYNFKYTFLITATCIALLSLYILRKPRHIISKHITTNTRETKDLSGESTPYVKLITLLFCVLIAGFIVSQISITYPVYLKSKLPQSGMFDFTLIFAVNSLLVVTCQTPIMNHLSKCNHSYIIAIGGLLLGTGMYSLSIFNTIPLLLLACMIYTLGEILFFSLAQLNCYQYAPNHKKGKSMGLFRMALASSRMIGPMLGGYLYQHIGGESIWPLCSMIGLCCCILSFAVI